MKTIMSNFLFICRQFVGISIGIARRVKDLGFRRGAIDTNQKPGSKPTGAIYKVYPSEEFLAVQG
jgi:hypothetical protein